MEISQCVIEQGCSAMKIRANFFTKSLCIAFALCLGSSTQIGCQNLVKRGQSPDPATLIDDQVNQSKTKYVGPITVFSGFEYAKLQAIGLVVGLKGTGSDPGPSWQREKLIDELKLRMKINDPQNLLASLDTAMVKVTAYFPPGAKKGDRADLLIEPFDNDEVKSLNGGRLLLTSLRPYAVLGNSVKTGNSMGSAEGFVLEDGLFEARQDRSNQVRGLVLGGGVLNDDRVLLLNVKQEKQGLKSVAEISYAINNRFTVVTGDGRVGAAKAKTDRVIELRIPETYRDNIGRFTQIISNIAFEENANDRVNRLDELERQLGDPEQARVATLRLEAIGKEATSVLKRALKHPNLEVRSHAAVALAYLDEADGIDVLREAVATERALRWHALAGLQVLSDPRAASALGDLMNAESAEARYGAFRTLKTRSPNDPLVKGTVLAKDFAFHVIPTTATPMVHVSRSKSPEIVLFGDEQLLSPDVLFLKSGLTVKGNDSGKIEVVRYIDGEKVHRIVGNRVSEVVQAMASVNCQYSTLIEFFRVAKQKEWLTSKLAINAVPRPGRERMEGEVESFADTDDQSNANGTANPEATSTPEFTQTRMENNSSSRKSSERKSGVLGKLGESFSKSKKVP
jgi:HEAT repeat protein